MPWRRPGFQLGLDIAAVNDANPQAIGVILGGHGITAWGDTSAECEANSLEIIAHRRRLHRRARQARAVRPGRRRIRAAARAERRAKAAALAPTCAAIASTDKPHGRALHRFRGRCSTSSPAPSTRGSPNWAPRCPDHFLRTKVRPLVLDLPPRPASRRPWRGWTSCTRLTGPTTRPTTTATRPLTPRRCAAPTRPSSSCPGVGMFSYGKDKQTARVAGEFYVNAINVMRGAEAISTYAPIRESEKFRIEYWALEEAKLRGMPQAEAAGHPDRPGDGGWRPASGKAIATRLAAEGACVVVADLDAEEAAAAAGGDRRHRRRGRCRGRRHRRGTPSRGRVDGRRPRVRRHRPGGQQRRAVARPSRCSRRPSRDWDLQHDVMAKGSFLVSRAAARVMIEQRLGRRHRLHRQQEPVFAGPNNIAYCADQGRPGPPGPAARGRARRARRQGQRHQPRRRRPRLRDLRRRLGRQTRCRLRGTRGGARRVLRPADLAQAGGPAGARRQRRLRALLG